MLFLRGSLPHNNRHAASDLWSRRKRWCASWGWQCVVYFWQQICYLSSRSQRRPRFQRQSQWLPRKTTWRRRIGWALLGLVTNTNTNFGFKYKYKFRSREPSSRRRSTLPAGLVSIREGTQVRKPFKWQPPLTIVYYLICLMSFSARSDQGVLREQRGWRPNHSGSPPLGNQEGDIVSDFETFLRWPRRQCLSLFYHSSLSTGWPATSSIGPDEDLRRLDLRESYNRFIS